MVKAILASRSLHVRETTTTPDKTDMTTFDVDLTGLAPGLDAAQVILRLVGAQSRQPLARHGAERQRNASGCCGAVRAARAGTPSRPIAQKAAGDSHSLMRSAPQNFKILSGMRATR
jgi:hypothetical protein